MSHLWLEISMTYLSLMENGKTLKKLSGNFRRVGLGPCFRGFDILGQVPILYILHCDEDEIAVCVPAKKPHKQVAALALCRVSLIPHESY